MSDYNEQLGAIEESEKAVSQTSHKMTIAMVRLTHIVVAVANDEFSVEILTENPQIDGGADLNVVNAALTVNREAMLNQLEEAVRATKAHLLARHTTEVTRNGLFPTASDETPSDGA
jgi:hypothetical protein